MKSVGAGQQQERKARLAKRLRRSGRVAVVMVTTVCASMALDSSVASATTPGVITTIAGSGANGDAVPAASTAFDFPTGIAVDSFGNLIVPSIGDNRLRVVAKSTGTYYGQAMTAGDTYVVAGQSLGGSSLAQPAPIAQLSYPDAAAVDPHGSIVIADNGNAELKVVPNASGTFYGQVMTAGRIYVVAGDGTSGYLGDGGLATSAELNGPGGIAVDATGNLVMADGRNNRVRVIAASTGTFYGQTMTAGDIYTVAGDGTAGYSGDGTTATSAELQTPTGVTPDAHGNIIIGDQANNRVRVVAASTGSFYGQAMSAGDIYTVAGTGTAGPSGDNGPGTSAELNTPSGVTVDSNGNVLIADTLNFSFRLLATTTGTFYGQPMTSGDIYTVVGNGINGDAGNGGPATSAELGYPNSVAIDSSGNLVVDDTSNHLIRVVASNSATFYGQAMSVGDIYTVAGDGTSGYSGDGGPARSAELSAPFAVAVDAHDNVITADANNNRIRITAKKTGTYYGIAMTKGHIYTVAGTGGSGYNGDGGLATSAMLAEPLGVAVDSHGNILISDSINKRIRAVAGTTGTFYGVSMTADDIYTVAGNGTSGHAGDGGPAVAAELGGVQQGISVDARGDLLLADFSNDRIRIVAAKTGTFYGISMTADDIYTVVGNGTAGYSGDGGKAKSAKLNVPTAVAADSHGNLVIGDTGNARVRVVAGTTGTFYGQSMTKGHIYTVAGVGTFGYAGDGGAATAAELSYNEGLAVDLNGNLVISDDHNNRVRVAATSTGTYYGVPMIAGDIYTVAGNGTIGYSGDGGAATSAELYLPTGVAVDTKGNIDIAEAGNCRIRQVGA
jgi:hypothetical protein